MVTFDTVQSLLDQQISVKKKLSGVDSIAAVTSPGAIVLLAGVSAVTEFMRMFPLSDTHVARPAADATNGGLSMFGSIPVVTDIYQHPALRMEPGVWLIEMDAARFQ